jgi:two-component system nitrogen regulation sensor histidine kinase GlnL
MVIDWQEICENMNTAVLLADHENQVVTVNTAIEGLLSIGRRSLIGKTIEDIFIGQQKIFNVIERARKYQSRYTLREVKFEKPTVFEADITVSSIERDDGLLNVMLEIVRTDRISRLARETQNIEQQQTNRLMMRSMSHEIKNPLSGIRGSAQLLSEELNDPELGEFTDIIIRESDRLTNLVNRVMGSHKQYAAEPVNIHFVTEHVARLAIASTGGSLELKRDYDPSLPEIIGDDEQLIQAVMNIVKNAIEAQNDLNAPFIGLRTRLERNFTIGKKLHRNLIRLQIWDFGSGVPEEIRSQIFNPMITGRAEGTGLGLAITQEIVQRHGGLVVLEDIDENTCFSIYLPIDITSKCVEDN